MAKRSDFAQKLLDDLRLRKEKMSASSQRSSQSHLPIDAYSYSKQTTSMGSRNTKGNAIVTSKTGNMVNRSSNSSRNYYRPSPNNGEVSNQIVSYGTGQSQLKMNDVSLAIAFALENGGKSRSGSSYNGFLHQIKRGTMEFSMMERHGGDSDRRQGSSNRFQVLSPLQINEISRGAQKLNQILRACSNGVNIDRHSFEIAKELFQGAIDLEESLRVLVDLQQQSSEFMVTSQKKNRITLLDEDSDDDDDDGGENKIIKIPQQNQLAPPIFSFDKASRHTNMQRQIILTNSKESRSSNNKKQNVIMSKVSQKNHTRSSSDIKNLNAISEQKNNSSSAKSNAEKGRIPSVIAKLMGLDNLPEKAEPKNLPQKDSGNNNTQKIRGNQGTTFQHTAKGSTKKAELNNNKETENLEAVKKSKVIETIKRPANQDEELVLGADKNLHIQNGKPLWSDLHAIKELQDFGKGRKQDPAPTNNTEQKITVKSRIDYPTQNNMLEKVNERSQVKPSLQEEKEINASNLQSAKRRTNKQTMINNQKKSQNHHREQQREKQTLPAKPRGGSELASSKNSPKNQHRLVSSQKKQLNQATPAKQNFAESVEATTKPEGFLSSRYDDLVKHETSKDTIRKVKEMNNKKSGGSIIAMVDEKSVHKLANMKVKNTRKQKNDMLGKIDKLLNERNGRKLDAKQVEQHIPVLQESTQGTPDRLNVLKEANQERVGTWNEADACIISPNESFAVAEAEAQDKRHPTYKEAESDQIDLALNESHQYMQSVTTDDLKDHAAAVVADEEFKTGEVALSTINGIHEDSMSISNRSKLQDQNISKIRIQEPLTESENFLKRILVTSQPFLDTAEAFFRLNIPSSKLQQDGDQDNEGECKDLAIGCSYEVMKRKGIRTELKVLPCSKKPISTINIASLDDLVRQLNKDMEKLKFYGRHKNSNASFEDYLPKMLEHDVNNREPDIDCMWDSGWNGETFVIVEKHDVIKDMEKHILNVLLDEITRELMHVEGGK